MIVDQQPIVLQGLKSVLGAQQDFDVVASCSDGTSCLEAIRNLTPDVALIADTLPDLTTAEILAIAKARASSHAPRILYRVRIQPRSNRAIAAGACSAVSKYASADTMLRLLRLLTKRSVPPDACSIYPPAARKLTAAAKLKTSLELLTHREREIVRLVSEGMSNKEIARRLNVSPGTVKVHLSNIFDKLEITNRTVLATLALLKRSLGLRHARAGVSGDHNCGQTQGVGSERHASA